MSRPQNVTDARIEAVQENSRRAWNRLVERDERELLKSVVDEATDVAKDAARGER